MSSFLPTTVSPKPKGLREEKGTWMPLSFLAFLCRGSLSVSSVALDHPYQGNPEGEESASLLKVLLILPGHTRGVQAVSRPPPHPLLLSTLHLSLPNRTDLKAREVAQHTADSEAAAADTFMWSPSLSASRPPHSACCEAEHRLPPLSGRKGKPVELRILVISPSNC